MSRYVLIVIRRATVVVGAVAVFASCGGDASSLSSADAATNVTRCMEQRGETLTVSRVPADTSFDQVRLSGELSDGGNVDVFVLSSTGEAQRAFDEYKTTIADGASELDFFRVGQVVVLFGEESKTAQQSLLRECADAADG